MCLLVKIDDMSKHSNLGTYSVVGIYFKWQKKVKAICKMFTFIDFQMSLRMLTLALINPPMRTCYCLLIRNKMSLNWKVGCKTLTSGSIFCILWLCITTFNGIIPFMKLQLYIYDFTKSLFLSFSHTYLLLKWIHDFFYSRHAKKIILSQLFMLFDIYFLLKCIFK